MIILKPQEIRTLLLFRTEEGIPENAANLLYLLEEGTAKRARISHRNYPAVHKGAVLVKRNH